MPAAFKLPVQKRFVVHQTGLCGAPKKKAPKGYEELMLAVRTSRDSRDTPWGQNADGDVATLILERREWPGDKNHNPGEIDRIRAGREFYENLAPEVKKYLETWKKTAMQEYGATTIDINEVWLLCQRPGRGASSVHMDCWGVGGALFFGMLSGGYQTQYIKPVAGKEDEIPTNWAVK